MTKLIYNGVEYKIDDFDGSILDAIKSLGLEFAADCGGRGTCKKCQVLIDGEQGLKKVLACQTLAKDAHTIYAETASDMII
ncbi:MAG: 2Fe-2S iron-sulfur cluster-binding protein, partial [Coriobacteriales bacterium]|nr:2Fe-2S iron-sulfur cluster-binding protein [Coriobacteriales bacterium]